MQELTDSSVIVAEALGAIYLLWLFYLAVMSLMRASAAGTLRRPAYILAVPVVSIGLLIDVSVNFLIVSILLWELPHWTPAPTARLRIRIEWTVTARLSRHKHDSAGWRQKVAQWIGDNLLDPFDPSGHHLK
jgi:hypothetical protein